ncbi:nitroreductase [Ephemerocybe angulata]|uniref:Nitroreductase n=1 Tax=Ephemerocybe angulata TaxID=980116 RepID=A0A8H6HFK3_9AGAR|nr:nitroreductase [Tulosesus angulatus]
MYGTCLVDLVDANAVELVDGLIKGRFSCRYFEEEREVERGVVEEILDAARFAPSGNNIQPWEKVYCLTGQTLARVKEDVLAAYQEQFKDGLNGELEEGVNVIEKKYTAQYAYYPRLLPGVYGDRKREFGRVLGETLGIERSDVKGRREAGGRNYQFYGAPVAMVFTINKELTQGSWLDVGFFLQSINIAARARGLETVTQESVTQYQAILRKHLPITENEVVAVTMGLGYPDVEMAARYEMERSRREVSDIVSFFD